MGEEALATRKPLIVEKIDYLDKEIARLFEKVDSLKERLDPILSPEPPEPQKVVGEEELPSSISSHLQKEIDRICELQNQIERIKKRLEV